MKLNNFLKTNCYYFARNLKRRVPNQMNNNPEFVRAEV